MKNKIVLLKVVAFCWVSLWCDILCKDISPLFTIDAFKHFLQGSFGSSLQEELKTLKESAGLFPPFHKKQKIQLLTSLCHKITYYEPYVLWHYRVATTGLVLNTHQNDDSVKKTFLPHSFTLHELAPSQGRGVKIALLEVGDEQVLHQFVSSHSCVKAHKNTMKLIGMTRHHAFHSMGIIKGSGPFCKISECADILPGIAPCVDIEVIIIANHVLQGGSWPVIIKGLEMALSLNVDILNISLEWSGLTDKKTRMIHYIERLLSVFPYVVAAAGNNGLSSTYNSFPASIGCIPFDVGALEYNPITDKYNLAYFSSRAIHEGPKFVASGTNILSTGLCDKEGVPTFLFMDGTSTAAPLMAGFVALMLSEFQQNFSREEMLAVCYYSCVSLSDFSQDALGNPGNVLDMRLALFTLHCLRYMRNKKLFSKELLSTLIVSLHYFFKENSGSLFIKEGYSLECILHEITTKIVLQKNVVIPQLHASFKRVFAESRQSSRLFTNNPQSFLQEYSSSKMTLINTFVAQTKPLQNYWKKQCAWNEMVL